MTSIFFNRNVPSKEIFVLDQNHLEKCQFFDYVGMTFLSFYSRTYKAGGRGGGGGGGGLVSISRRNKLRILEVFVYEFLAWSHLI